MIKKIKLPWLIIGLIVISVIVLPIFFRDKKTSYEPLSLDDKGYVGKANALFADLLTTYENTDIKKVSTIEELNKRYPAFVFDVPENLPSRELNIYDIRLVNIVDSIYIKKDKDRTFYESSDLRSLLKQQQLDKDKPLFNLGIEKRSGDIRIKSIRMISNLHKIKFKPDIWEGELFANYNNPISEENSRFIIYGSSVLPIAYQEKVNLQNSYYNVSFIDDESRKGIFIKGVNDLYQPIDWHEHYKLHYRNGYPLCLQFPNEGSKSVVMQLCKDHLFFEISPDISVLCIVGDVTERFNGRPDSHLSDAKFNYPSDCENIRVIIERQVDISKNHYTKIAEFQLAKHNPLSQLAYVVNTNKGKTRKQIDSNYTDVFTHQVVDNFLKNAPDSVDTPIHLSIDPLLSAALERELKQYLENTVIGNKKLRNGENVEISICVINTATGEILAAPYYEYMLDELTRSRKISKRNPNLERRYVGSCFKPLLALASTQLYPQLIDLETGGTSNRSFAPDSEEKSRLLGCPVKGPFASAKHYKNPHDMKTFLGVSNNVFPVLLAMYSFTEFPDYNPLSAAPSNLAGYIHAQNSSRANGIGKVSLLNPKEGNTNLYPNESFDIHKSEFAKVMSLLYEIKSESVEVLDSLSPLPSLYLLRYWNNKVSLPEISPDYTNMNYDVWNKEQGNNFRGQVVPWVLGQGTNEWAPLKFAESWARMVTKYPVQLSYIHNDDAEVMFNKKLLSVQVDSMENKKGGNRDLVWNRFLKDFQGAQTYGDILKVAHNSLNTANERCRPLGKEVIILGKTGTPSDDSSRSDFESLGYSGKVTYDIGLYTFSLLTQAQLDKIIKNELINRNTIPNAGITAVIRVVHSYPSYLKGNSAIGNIGSSQAR